MAEEPPQLTIADLLDPAEIAAARAEQRAMLRQALGDQYPAWLKLNQGMSKKRKKLGDLKKEPPGGAT